MKLVICLLFAALFAFVAVTVADEPDFDEDLEPYDFDEEIEKRDDDEGFGGCNASGNKVKITKDNKVIEKACMGEWSSWTRCRPWRKHSKRITCKEKDDKTGKCKLIDEETRSCKKH